MEYISKPYCGEIAMDTIRVNLSEALADGTATIEWNPGPCGYDCLYVILEFAAIISLALLIRVAIPSKRRGR